MKTGENGHFEFLGQKVKILASEPSWGPWDPWNGLKYGPLTTIEWFEMSLSLFVLVKNFFLYIYAFELIDRPTLGDCWLNVPSYPVISFIIFYQVKWQGKDASMGELPIWAVLFVHWNRILIFSVILQPAHCNLNNTAYPVIYYFSFIQLHLLFKLHPVGVQWKLNFKSDRDM